MQLKAALDKFVAEPKDPEAQRSVAVHMGERQALVLTEDRTGIDVALSLELEEHLRDEGILRTGSGKWRKRETRTLTAWISERKPDRPADPISGDALDPEGVSTDSEQVDWSPLPERRRLLAAYAAETGQLPQPSRHLVVRDLSQKRLLSPWPRLDGELQALLDSTRRTAAEEDLLRRVRGRLVRRESPSRRAPPEPEPPPPSSVRVGGHVQDSTIVSGNGNRVVVSGNGNRVGPTYKETERAEAEQPHAHALRMLVVYDPKDAAALGELRNHLAMSERQGLVTIEGIEEMLAGVNKAGHVARSLASADLIVAVLSSSFAGGSLGALVLSERARRGVYVVPVHYRSCDLGEFSHLQPVPRDRPVRTYGDQDDAWQEVARELKRMMIRLRGAAA